MFGSAHVHRAARLGGGLLILTAGLAACNHDNAPAPDAEQALAQLRQAVEPFHDLSAAQQAGYEVVVTHPTNGRTCLRDPQLGAMGVHYLKTALADDTVLATQPELMIYEPQQDGSMTFVAVEYIIPFSIRGEDQPPPVLFGHEFTQNHTFNVWALHAWVGRDNQSGTFADYNPDVSCQFAEES